MLTECFHCGTLNKDRRVATYVATSLGAKSLVATCLVATSLDNASLVPTSLVNPSLVTTSQDILGSGTVCSESYKRSLTPQGIQYNPGFCPSCNLFIRS